MRKGGTLRLFLFYSPSVPSKSLYADKADCFIVPTYGCCFLLQVSWKHKTFRQHWCSNSLGLVWKQKATSALPACTVPRSSGSLPPWAPQTRRFKQSIYINQYHFYVPISKSCVRSNPWFKCFPLSYLLPRTAKLSSGTCKCLISQAHDGTNHLPIPFFFIAHSWTWLPARLCCERERELAGLLGSHPPQVQCQGSSHQYVIGLGRQRVCFGWHFQFMLFILTWRSICLLPAYSPLLRARLRVPSPASLSGLELKNLLWSISWLVFKS